MKFILSLAVLLILLQAGALHFRCFMVSVIAIALLYRFPLILPFFFFLIYWHFGLCIRLIYLFFFSFSRIFASSTKVLVVWAIFLSTY